MFGSFKYFNQFDVLWYSYLATNEIFENAKIFICERTVVKIPSKHTCAQK